MSRLFLAERRIGLSVSDSPDLAQLGLGPEHVEDALVEVTRYLVASGATVVYGGDLRRNGFTELLLEVIARHQVGSDPAIRFENFLAWPVHASMPFDTLAATDELFAPVGKLICLTPEGEEMSMVDRAGFDQARVDDEEWGPALTAMRTMLAIRCDARIVAGGATSIYKGSMPGVAEEALLSLRAERPTFVLGGLGGCAMDIAAEAGLGPALIGGRTHWPERERFAEVESLNPGLDRDEAILLASAKPGTETLILLLKGLHGVLPSRLRRQSTMEP